MIGVELVDGTGARYKAKVSEYGQVITAPISYNRTASQTLALVGTPYNFIEPLSGHKIIVDGILLYANKAVGAADATVTIYSTPDGVDALTNQTVILTTEMLKQTSRDLIGLNCLTETGVWVNATTSDTSVFATLLYYYVPVVSS